MLNMFVELQKAISTLITLDHKGEEIALFLVKIGWNTYSRYIGIFAINYKGKKRMKFE